MQRIVLLAISFAISSGWSPAQTVTDVPLPPGLPTVLGAPYGPTPLSMYDVEVFAERDALAFVDGATVRRWTGLPSAAAYASLALSPPQRLVVGWKVARDVLLYWSVGPDLQPGTGDERLCMVRGLPYQAQVVTTTITPTPGVPLYPFFEVGPQCAVSANPSGFQVVVHGAWGATLQDVPVAGGLPLLGSTAGRVDSGTVATYGGGGDLVLLRGLDGTGPYTLETAAMPGVASLRSFVVTDDGVGVGLSWSSLPTVTAHAIRIPPVAGPLTASSITWIGPTSGVCSGVCWAYLSRIPGGGARIEAVDDTGYGLCVIGDLRGTPAIRWSSGYLAPDELARPLAEDEILATHAYASPGAFTYTRVTPSGLRNVVTSGLVDHEYTGTVRLGRGCFAYTWRSVSGSVARVTVMRDALGASATSTSSINGMITRAVPLAGSAVAAFVDTSGTSGVVSPSTLRIVSAPRASIEALADPVGPPPIALTMTPSLGALSQGLTVSLQTNPTWSGVAALFLAVERQPVGQAWSGFDGLVHLDLASYLGAILVGVDAAGSGQFVAPPGALPAALAGFPLHVQAATYGGGLWRLSDLGVILLE